MTSWCLVGQPNVGKTTFFNQLTGKNQPIGNWNGVTVDYNKSVILNSADNKCIIIDLPGINSLNADSEITPLDSIITLKHLYDYDYTGIIQVIDAMHLEKNLYLTSQLIELNKPIVLVINKIDLAKKNGIEIDVNYLEKLLGIKVLLRHDAFPEDFCKMLISTPENKEKVSLHSPCLQKKINLYIDKISQALKNTMPPAKFLAIRFLEGSTFFSSELNFHITNDTVDELEMHDARYNWAHKIAMKVQKKSQAYKDKITMLIDSIVLNRLFGIPLFLSLIFAVFYTTMTFGQAIQVFITENCNAYLLEPMSKLIHHQINMNFADKLWQGVSQGVITWLGLIPVLVFLYLWMVFLEASGYMARAAFLMDRIMRFFGLPGKSFIPMILGFGCNVPAILATRTLATKYERIVTCLMIPFMSCSARLTIYAVFISIFFPAQGYLILFALYLLGVVLAIVTGMILRKFFIGYKSPPLVMEMPTYTMPNITMWFNLTLKRVLVFMRRSGLMIVSVALVISILNTIFWPGSKDHTILYVIGNFLTPVFSYMGITPDNWPATVGLIGGFLAKEVVLGTLVTLYGEINPLNYHLSLPYYFHGQIPAFAYLLFILLYVPCVSTFAAMKQEIGMKWVVFSVLWSLVVAYGVSVLFYQSATFLVS